MKTLFICGDAAHQKALANKLHAVIPLTAIALIKPKPARLARRLARWFTSITIGLPLRRAWFGMTSYFRERYPDYPVTEISCYNDVNSEGVIDLVKRIRPELVIVSGGSLLKKPLLDAIWDSGRVLNLHTGISPYVKGGPNCTNWCLAIREFDLIGNTIMWLDVGIDSGHIVVSERTPLGGTESLRELHVKVLEHGHDLYVRCVRIFSEGGVLPSVPQKSFGSGRLFLSKDWTALQAMKAVLNYFLYFRSPSNHTRRPVGLVSLEEAEARTRQNRALPMLDSRTLSVDEKMNDRPRAPLIALALPSLGYGGTEAVCGTLGAEFLRRGFRVDFVTGWEEPEAVLYIPAQARNIVLGARRVREALLPLVRYLRREQPDAIIVSLWPFTTLGVLAHRLARSSARLVLLQHNMLSLQYRNRGAAHWAFLRLSMAYECREAAVTIGVSGGVADDLSILAGMPRHKFPVIHNPLRVRPAIDAKDADAEAVWDRWRGPRIITVGVLKAQKNHALLIRAFKKLLKERDARLLILGTGDLAKETSALVRAEGLADKVLLPGAVPDPTPYYRSADLFVLSSNYEGFGNVVVEALSQGLPVVSTDCQSGPAEILENGRYGRLVPVGDEDALAQAMQEALGALHDAEALKRRALDFSPERIGDQYLRLLFPDAPVHAE